MAYGKRVFSIAAGAGTTAVTGPGGLFGITIRETTAVAAAGTIIIYDNTSAAGTRLATIRVAADGKVQFNWTRGIKFGVGLHVATTGADIGGSLLVGSQGGLRALPFAGVDLLLRSGPMKLDSILASETAGAVAEWRVVDSLTAAGSGFAGGAMAANETTKLEWTGGMTMTTGLFFDNVTGATSGNAYVY